VGQHRGERGDGAAAQGPDPGHQLGEVERLGQVVIRAQAQTLDPVGDGGGRGQHQHPARAPACGQVRADLVPVYPGQVPVQHDHVIAGQGHMIQRVLPVEGHIDGHALVAQPARHRLGEPPVIFHHQHSHALSPLPPSGLPGQLRRVLAARMPGAR
jgi:hypothetical protein